ncbi:MAG TPA: trypsin-like peptidase domain-containing protein, partial [Gammaproteobacteria bacterium]|nr:trypsin-like peptidase domain-containing protein [Gammaproteobacteria bacterium]
MTRIRTHLLAVAAAMGLVGTGAMLESGLTPAHATPTVPADTSISDVAERVVESVVNISSEGTGESPAMSDPFFTDPMSPFFGGTPSRRMMQAKGSGVIVSSDGRILTNSHVVNGFQTIRVTLQDGSEYAAKVVGKDTKTDLAVLQLQGKFPALKPLAFGDSSKLRLGEIVLAIGDGLGVGKSVSMGIVSAKGRGGIGIEEYEDFIQTDAAINPGNSGGALVNMKGELVGINTAIASRSGGYQGIGFAIPSNMARPIMEMLARDGKVTRGYLGVDIATVTPAVLKQVKLGSSYGVVVGDVEKGTPASKAGLHAKDVITAFNGKPMRSADTLRTMIAMAPPGSTVELEVVHPNGNKSTVHAKLGELPEKLHASVDDDDDDNRGNFQQHFYTMGPDGQWHEVSPEQLKRH